MYLALKRSFTLAGLSVFATAGLGLTSVAPASASDCIPVGANFGTTKVTVCVAVDPLFPGFPGVGLYGVAHGYVEVCDPTCRRSDYLVDQTGVAVNSNDYSVSTSGTGTPLPQVCVGSTCSPATSPAVTVKIFSDFRTVTIRYDGTQQDVELPTVCVTTVSGGCSGPLPVSVE